MFKAILVNKDKTGYHKGQPVLLNGWGVGEQSWGGLAQKARVRGEWLIPLPTVLYPSQAMAIGTAGYTAMLCVLALEKHGVTPEKGDILVTGANGGVGSIAVLLLARLGYRVVASTGRTHEAEHLFNLGAAEVVDRATLIAPGKPLQKERWAGVIDSLGSHTLANACASTQADGVVTTCGLAQGLELATTVAPFILRGISLLGINSVTRPQAERVTAWARLSRDIDFEKLETLTRTIGLTESIACAQSLLAGQVRGRLVVDVNR
ncbi:oxidoreductase [Acetobacter okinawensis]|uniref:MDR family oxidoreductase n=1 Tax=Acetobacter okinawensis TaxID=1076594 RepID=UPI001BAD5FF5|nr:MDR family oxidoreductase [Acetobacter okinawensis]MBS0965358.1 oxidoreductase [Acetobacter okinawensis]MBS0987992.1 oxidoreductase [Acetobacter okinawensis]